jgi:hypothetical protein
MRPPSTATRRAVAVWLALVAAPGAAEAIGADAFGAMAEGRTLRFTLDGAPFGAERYFAGRRTLWRFEGGECLQGRWWAEGELICFSYDGPAQCWRFLERRVGFAAELVEDGAATGFVLELSGVDERPLDCPGPGVGS